MPIQRFHKHVEGIVERYRKPSYFQKGKWYYSLEMESITTEYQLMKYNGFENKAILRSYAVRRLYEVSLSSLRIQYDDTAKAKQNRRDKKRNRRP